MPDEAFVKHVGTLVAKKLEADKVWRWDTRPRGWEQQQDCVYCAGTALSFEVRPVTLHVFPW